MKVRCINNNWNNLTKGKVYDVIHIIDSEIQIYNDSGNKQTFYIGNFEVIKEENKMQEKTFREVIADIKEREVWICEKFNRKIIKGDDGVIEIRKLNDETFNNTSALIFNDEKYKLQRKEYTFEEAFKAYEEGKEIESCYTGTKYKFEKLIYFYKRKNIEDWQLHGEMQLNEIRSKWYINN